MRKSNLFAWLATTLGAGLTTAVVNDIAKDVAPIHKEFVLFRSANMPDPDKLPNGDGFHSFRAPAVVTAVSGRILAFAEGRRNDNRAFGDVRVVLKRTKTTNSHGSNPTDWEGLQDVVVRAEGLVKGRGVWSNPTPVVDGATIHLFVNWHSGEYSRDGNERLPNGRITKKIDEKWDSRRHVFLLQSTDDGQTWSEPQDMTRKLTSYGWSWDAVGPGNGIVMTSGEVVVPAMGRNIIGRGVVGQRKWRSKKIRGAGVEGTVVQLPDGRLYRNDRGRKDDEYRSVARGTLGRFGHFYLDKNLPDPGCAGAMLMYNRPEEKPPARIVFLNSADKNSKRAMRVRISYDGFGKYFTEGRKLSDAPVAGVGNEGGYASMTRTADSLIGALVETDFHQTGGSKDDYRAIVWRKFNLSWILHAHKE